MALPVISRSSWHTATTNSPDGAPRCPLAFQQSSTHHSPGTGGSGERDGVGSAAPAARQPSAYPRLSLTPAACLGPTPPELTPCLLYPKQRAQSPPRIKHHFPLFLMTSAESCRSSGWGGHAFGAFLVSSDCFFLMHAFPHLPVRTGCHAALPPP